MDDRGDEKFQVSTMRTIKGEPPLPAQVVALYIIARICTLVSRRGISAAVLSSSVL